MGGAVRCASGCTSSLLPQAQQLASLNVTLTQVQQRACTNTHSSNVLTGMWASSEARRASVAANTTNTRTCVMLTLVTLCTTTTQLKHVPHQKLVLLHHKDQELL